MSKTHYVEFRGNGFWVFDVASSVFLKFLIDAATETSGTVAPWLVGVVQEWRINAVVSDVGFYLDSTWSQSQLNTVVTLCRLSAERIRARGDISAKEVESWPILEDGHICTRGIDPIPCEPVARIGDAIVSLIENTLPQPPAHHEWCYTLDEDLRTIPVK